MNIKPFEKAIASLENALLEQEKAPQSSIIRDGCIQRFEYTYELSHKMLKRFLENTSANSDDLDSLSFQDIIRTGNERRLLRSDWPVWKGYREARGTTSHAYDEEKAVEVFAIIPDFLTEARFLRDRLREGINA